MLTALVLILALDIADSPSGCFEIELSTAGRSAHGSAVMPESAPHQLIRALDRLPEWSAAQESVLSTRIVALTAAPAVNIIPRRAAGIVAVSTAPGADGPAGFVADLGSTLGPTVEVQLLAEPCRPVA